MASELLQARLQLIAAKAKIMAAQDMWPDDLVRGLNEISIEVEKALQEARGQARDNW